MNRNKLTKISFRCGRKTGVPEEKPVEESLDWKPKRTYSAGTGNVTRSQWSTAQRK